MGQPQPGDTITILNEAQDTVLQWRVNYGAGESSLSGDVYPGQENAIALSTCPGLTVGEQCWPLIEPLDGPNHECGGNNVAYEPGAGNAQYAITGTVDDLSCDGPY